MSAGLFALCPPPASARPEGPSAADALAQGFQTPPNSARPRVWWHWMNGNITKDGIRKDLDWMSRVGIGGLQTFDVALATPQVVPHRLAYMTPEWGDAFRFAAKTADHLGLEFGIASSPGWSESGGPWVSPQDGMKKLVWSQVIVDGGHPLTGPLPHPPTLSGPYQDIPGGDMGAASTPTAYGDVVVLAFPLPDEPASTQQPQVEASTGQGVTLSALADAGGEGILLKRGSAGAPAYLTLTYDTPQTIRSASIFLAEAAQRYGAPSVAPTLEVQGPDGAWRKLADIEVGFAPTTVSFAPVTARRFRLALHPAPQQLGDGPLGLDLPGVATPGFGAPPSPVDRVTLFQLSSRPRVNRFEAKAGFDIAANYYALDASVGPEVEGVDPKSVIDLTDKLRPDAQLNWTPPAGRWKVLRLGWSLEGSTNTPATREATGLEVDKYDAAAVQRYVDTYLGLYRTVVGAKLMGAHGMRAQVNDSTEVGASNWTPELLAQFQSLRDYDPRPWLPALTGVIVGSRAKTDAFLYDFRRTLSDLESSQHYATVTKVVHGHGMAEYGEALESSRAVLGDDMTMRSFADVPMAALWAYNPAIGPRPVFLADMRGAASVAHVYGRQLAAAESMTSYRAPWAFAPWQLKQYIDLEFASGINRPVIHTSVHQPVDDKVPGLSLSIFGQYFNRHESWAEMAKPWVDYMSRSAFMLQQGRNLADVAYFYGEEAPLVSLYEAGLPADAPTRYAYDFVSPDVVMKELRVSGHALVSRGGARYRVLYLGGSSDHMTLAMLRRIAELVGEGATVVGTPPRTSPSLKDDPAEFSALVRRLWGDRPITSWGKGEIIATKDVEMALRLSGVTPDFSYVPQDEVGRVLFVHRRIKGSDIYFLNNRSDRPEHIEARFRASGKAPEIWRADTGQVEPVSYRTEGAATAIPLDLAPEDALFVVFRRRGERSRSVPTRHWKAVGQVDGSWDLRFQEGRGAPAKAHFDRLQSLTESADPRIKYFSGVVRYTSSFELPKDLAPGQPLALDLGKVGDIARVWVNGRQAGYAWKAPWRVQIGKMVRPGRNTIEVRVADLWVNRLIGDAQPDTTPKITFTTIPTYSPDAPLRAAGLIGPVRLLAGDKSRRESR